MKNPTIIKLAAMTAVAGCLAYGLYSIGGIVGERHGNQRMAEANVEQDQVGKQTLLGPVLLRNCAEEWQTWEGEGAARKPRTSRQTYTLSAPPATLLADAQVSQDPRYRGIFRIDTYAARTQLRAEWPASALDLPEPTQPEGRVQCSAPTLMVALMDARGIRSAQASVNGQEVAIAPGTQHESYPRGFSMRLDEHAVAGGPLSAEVALELQGAGQLSFAPVGESTQVHMKSDWPHPSFGGRFLPAERNVGEQGFEATWRVFSLATTAPADLGRGTPLCADDMRHNYGDSAPGTCIESFGVAFFDPVNPYVLSSRAVKYGMLFVGLTFIAVAMLEVLRRLRVHPVQYLLVGCALSIFFLLLLSLSEHMPFGWAYAGASAACSALLAVYVGFAMGGKRIGLAFGTGVAGLYGALYVVLQSEQAALMMGSLLLFAVLTTVMLATRKLDWYGVLGSGEKPATQKPASLPTP